MRTLSRVSQHWSLHEVCSYYFLAKTMFSRTEFLYRVLDGTQAVCGTENGTTIVRAVPPFRVETAEGWGTRHPAPGLGNWRQGDFLTDVNL